MCLNAHSRQRPVRSHSHCLELAIDAADFSRLLVVAKRDTAPGYVYRMPWETGWAGVVLGGSRGSKEHFTVQGPPPLTPRLKRLPEPFTDSSLVDALFLSCAFRVMMLKAGMRRKR